jgi:hypothetical protein
MMLLPSIPTMVWGGNIRPVRRTRSATQKLPAEVEAQRWADV